jgi:hypothetical protein
MSEENDSDWIPASEALELLKDHFSGSVATKQMLADRLRDGHLRARADRIWNTYETVLAKAWRSDPDDDAKSLVDVEIPTLIWRKSKRWRLDQENWRWPVNKFHVTCKVNPVERKMISGIRFYASDVQEFLKEVGAVADQKKRGGGRRPEEEAWTALTIALIQLERDGRLNSSCFDSQVDLRNELLELIGDAVKEGTIIKRIRAVWKHFVEQ